MILTKKLLKHFDSCTDGINFCERSKLFGLDLSKINLDPELLNWDYKTYVEWLNEHIIPINLEYDSAGNIIVEQKPNGYRIEYKYDSNNKIEEYLENTYLITYYYEDNRLIKQVNSDGLSYIWEYDENNNKIKQYSNHNDSVMTFTYDERNNCTSLQDSRGFLVKYEYDTRNNMVRLINHDDRWSSWEYDDNNNMVFYTTSKDNWLKMEYDSVGNVIKTIDSGGNIEENILTYYPNGQIKSIDNFIFPLIDTSPIQ